MKSPEQPHPPKYLQNVLDAFDRNNSPKLHFSADQQTLLSPVIGEIIELYTNNDFLQSIEILTRPYAQIEAIVVERRIYTDEEIFDSQEKGLVGIKYVSLQLPRIHGFDSHPRISPEICQSIIATQIGSLVKITNNSLGRVGQLDVVLDQERQHKILDQLLQR